MYLQRSVGYFDEQNLLKFCKLVYQFAKGSFRFSAIGAEGGFAFDWSLSNGALLGTKMLTG